MLSLAIHHNVWLTRDQRYALHNGIEIVVVGSSIPVWVSPERITSEPAKEVFCKYYLQNTKIESPIKILKDGYEIVLPNRQGTSLKITDEDWRYLNWNNPDKLESLYNKCQKRVNSENLLDISDGGSKHLSFREHNKSKILDTIVNVIHFVSIKDIEELTSTLTTA